MDRIVTGVPFTWLIGLGLLLFAFISFMQFTAYLEDGSVGAFFQITPCIIAFIIVFVITYIFNISSGLIVARASKSNKSLRAFYILLFYPIILLCFLFSSIAEGFQTVFIFGFPFFILGAILMVYAVHTVKGEAHVIMNKNLLIFYCFNCRYLFEMHRLEKERRCPWCGAININQFHPESQIMNGKKPENKINKSH
jgi:hypothetical protein